MLDAHLRRISSSRPSSFRGESRLQSSSRQDSSSSSRLFTKGPIDFNHSVRHESQARGDPLTQEDVVTSVCSQDVFDGSEILNSGLGLVAERCRGNNPNVAGGELDGR